MTTLLWSRVFYKWENGVKIRFGARIPNMRNLIPDRSEWDGEVKRSQRFRIPQVSSLAQWVHSLFQNLPDFSSFALTQITCLVLSSTTHGLKCVFPLRLNANPTFSKEAFQIVFLPAIKSMWFLPSLDFTSPYGIQLLNILVIRVFVLALASIHTPPSSRRHTVPKGCLLVVATTVHLFLNPAILLFTPPHTH